MLRTVLLLVLSLTQACDGCPSKAPDKRVANTGAPAAGSPAGAAADTTVAPAEDGAVAPKTPITGRGFVTPESLGDGGVPTPGEDHDAYRKGLAAARRELPLTSTGAESAEQAIRTFFDSAAKGDMTAVKNMLLSKADLEAIAQPAVLERARDGVVESLWRARNTFLQAGAVTSFIAGETVTLDPSRDKSVKASVTAMKGAQVVLTSGARVGLDRVFLIGGRWKLGGTKPAQ